MDDLLIRILTRLVRIDDELSESMGVGGLPAGRPIGGCRYHRDHPAADFIPEAVEILLRARQRNNGRSPGRQQAQSRARSPCRRR